MLAPKAFMHQTCALTRLLCTKPTQFVQDSARSRAFESRFAQITGRRAARRAPALGDAAATAAVAAIFEAFFNDGLPKKTGPVAKKNALENAVNFSKKNQSKPCACAHEIS